MGIHYIIQGIFVLVGLLAILASLLNWEWFFTAHNTQFIVHNVGRQRARLFYALLGLMMIATRKSMEDLQYVYLVVSIFFVRSFF